MKTYALCLLAWQLLQGCQPDLSVPNGALIECVDGADCPRHMQCSSMGRCIPQTNNQAPTVTIGTVARSIGVIRIPVRVFDAESDSVTLLGELGESGIYRPVIISPSTIVGTPEGQEVELLMDAADYLTDSYRQGLTIRLTPQDATGIGPRTISESFSYGNDAPNVLGLTVETDIVGVASGYVFVVFTVTDTSFDKVALSSFEIGFSGDFTDSIQLDTTQTHFPDITTISMSSAPTGVEHRLLWNTGASLPAVHDGVRIRLSVSDTYGTQSDVAESGSFGVTNAPSVALLMTHSTARPMNTVALKSIADDPNRPPYGDDSVSVYFEYTLSANPHASEAVWYDVTLAQDSDPTVDLVNLGPAVEHTLLWDALTDALFGNKGLSAEAVETSDLTEVQVVHYQSTVTLRATPRDSADVWGTPAYSPTFAVGNDPPLVSLEPLPGIHSKEVTIAYVLQDSAGDSSDIFVQFQLATDGIWRRALLSRGSTANLATAPSGIQHLVTWDTLAPLHENPGIPQGIGQQSVANVRLRMRGGDSPDEYLHYFGAWSNEEMLAEIRNQTPPRLEEVVARRTELALGTAPVAITYRLIDDEGDPVDIQFQYSFDLGQTWNECSEYRIAQSEGRYGLAAAPANADGSGGIEHVFVWDATGLSLEPKSSTRIRLLATDGKSETITSYEAQLVHPISPPATDSYFGSGDTYDLEDIDGSITVGPTSIAVADMNDDGILDLVVVGTMSASIAVLLGRPASSLLAEKFDAPLIYDAGIFPIEGHVIAADFNNDGRVDLALVGRSSVVRVLLNTGNNGAAEPQFSSDSYGLGLYAQGYEVRAADVNSDGALDLAVVDHNNNRVVVLLGNGDGSFAEAVTYSVPAKPVTVAIADVNGDGALDIVTAGTSTVSVLWGNGIPADGTFAPFETLRTGINAQSIAAGDFNNDGFVEIAVGRINGSVGGLLLLREEEQEQLEIALPSVPREVHSVDVNGDGILDFVAVSRTASQVSVILGQHAGSAVVYGLATPYTFVDHTWSVGLADFNSDGMLDMAAAVYRHNAQMRVDVLFSAAFGLDEQSFAATLDYPLGANTASARIVDVNEDGVQDLVVLHASASSPASILRGRGKSGLGDGTFWPAQSLAVGTAALADAVVADVNQDGIVDLIAGSKTTHQIWVMQGVGATAGTEANFTTLHVLDLSGNLRAFSVADVDGDGVLDIVVALSTPSSIAVFLGTLEDGYHLEPAIDTPLMTGASDSPSDLAIGDFDHDGLLDVAVSVTSFGSGNEVVILNNLGDGALSISARHPQGFSPTRLATADLDDDGILDLVVHAGHLWVWRGLGSGGVANGTFDADCDACMYQTRAGIGSLRIVDLNNDGILDIAAGFSFLPATVTVLEGLGSDGLGSATFAERVEMVGLGGKIVLPADLNGDGVLDLVVGGTGNTASSILGQRRGGLAWRRALRQGIHATTGTVGSQVLPQRLDKFGEPEQHGHLSARIARSLANGEDVVADLRRASVAKPSSLRPLTAAWLFAGDRHWKRLADPTGSRLCVLDRFGPDHPIGDGGLGLDLSPATFEEQRGLVIELPILPARLPLGDDSHTIRVYAAKRQTTLYLAI